MCEDISSFLVPPSFGNRHCTPFVLLNTPPLHKNNCQLSAAHLRKAHAISDDVRSHSLIKDLNPNYGSVRYYYNTKRQLSYDELLLADTAFNNLHQAVVGGPRLIHRNDPFAAQ